MYFIPILETIKTSKLAVFHMIWVYLPILVMLNTPVFALRTLNGRVIERQGGSVMPGWHLLLLRQVIHAASTEHAGTLGRVVFWGVTDEQAVVCIHCHHVGRTHITSP